MGEGAVSILSDSAILNAIEHKHIVIRPFDRARLGSNSYDVTLAKTLATYEPQLGLLRPYTDPLNVRRNHKLHYWEIPEEGLVLTPRQLVLGATNEYTESHFHVPFLEGKSSLARLGVQVHLTAGVGDVGFCGHWTLEILVTAPIRIYADMPVGQLIFHSVAGEVIETYDKKGSAKYATSHRRGPTPVASAMWKNFSKLPPLEPGDVVVSKEGKRYVVDHFDNGGFMRSVTVWLRPEAYSEDAPRDGYTIALGFLTEEHGWARP